MKSLVTCRSRIIDYIRSKRKWIIKGDIEKALSNYFFGDTTARRLREMTGSNPKLSHPNIDKKEKWGLVYYRFIP